MAKIKSIEEKARAYDEALKVLHKYDGANIMFSQSLKEEMFPEIKESEDERIKNEIRDFICWATDRGSITKEQMEKSNLWLAWLEKQGEQILDNSAKTCKDEQKPAWSEEEEKKQNYLIALLQNSTMNNPALRSVNEGLEEWLKSLKDRIQPQPKQEWSEEDENTVASIISSLSNPLLYPPTIHDIEWLKSLRPQSSWKPSDEQMDALNDVISSRDIKYDVLSELWQDLEKLKKGIKL